jgi:hypothetical protein
MTTEKNELQKSSGGPAVFNFFDPEQFKTMQRVCTMFANSELVPEMYKVSEKNPIEKAIANCMVAIEISQRIGASPLMVMQNMVPIYGKPSWSSKFLIATVNSCGRFEPMQYRFEDLGTLENVEYIEYEWNGKAKAPVSKKFPGPIQNIQCIAFTRKRGGTEILESIPVSIEMAIKEGWFTKNGSKWKTMSRLMLTYRAASFWTSAYAPELSMGIKTVEETLDIQDISHEEIFDDKIKAQANKEALQFAPETKPEPEPKPEQPKKDPVKAFEEEGKKAEGEKEQPKGAAGGQQMAIEPSFA